jgi:substrate import-associated zinc metallohydrolase lipoprotein
MKRNLNFKLSFIILSLLLSISCKKEKKLSAEIEPAVSFANTPLGQKQKEFFDKYDVLFEYNWDRNVFARNAIADPASINDVLPYMEIMEELYFKALANVAENGSFVKKQTPLTVYLIGSGINYGGSESFGESTSGQAGNIQPNRLTLGGLTNFGVALRKKNADAAFLNMIYEAATFSNPGEAGLIGFLYHEYTHYVNVRNDIPVPFALAAAANYLKGTNAYQSTTAATAYSKGFFIPYGMQNEMEDFATYVQIIVWKTPAQIQATYLKSTESTKKYQYVLDYYKNLGLDLNKLREYLQTQEVKDRLITIKRKYEQ